MSKLFIALILVAACAGCKRAKEQKADLGTEASPDQIDEALAKAVNDASLAGLHVGEYLNFVILRRIENGENTMLLGGTNVSIIAAGTTSDPLQTKFTLQINKSFRNNDGSFQNIATEDPLVVEHAPPPAPGALSSARALNALNALSVHAARAQDLSVAALTEWAAKVTRPQGGFVVGTTTGPFARATAITADSGGAGVSSDSGSDSGSGSGDGASSAVRASDDGSTPTVVRTTFHKLREGDDTLAVPDKVRLKADCGGLENCQIPMHFIRFDLVNWYSDTDYQKISLDFGFSAQTPYLPFGTGFDRLTGILVVDCRSTYVQLETRNVYVRDCQQLEDLQK